MDNTKHDPAVVRKRVHSWCTKLAALGDEPTFEDVEHYHFGLARVIAGKRIGYIDKECRFVWAL